MLSQGQCGEVVAWEAFPRRWHVIASSCQVFLAVLIEHAKPTALNFGVVLTTLGSKGSPQAQHSDAVTLCSQDKKGKSEPRRAAGSTAHPPAERECGACQKEVSRLQLLHACTMRWRGVRLTPEGGAGGV